MLGTRPRLTTSAWDRCTRRPPSRGARRAVVLRAIAAASDPQAASRELRELLDAYELDG